VLHYGRGPAATSVPGLDQGRILRIERDVLEHNRGYAQANRTCFARERVLALNLMSSPGAGKTTLLTRTIAALRDRLSLGVIEGDQQTSMDAERIRAAGAAAIQVNTGKGCHLDARMVGEAHAQLKLAPGGLLLIENVGNLVCPALWDLGEAARVVMLSVTEGEDKPLKYPDMFAVADLLLITKIDLLPHLDFDLQRCLDNARRIRPELETLCVSARSGEGLPAWIHWIETARQPQAAPSVEAELEAMRARVAALETELAHVRRT
jgi:hydrogenase nickel incorporation protein HypB